MSNRKPAISKEWQKLFDLIPGYDPVATAGDCYFDATEAKFVIEFFDEILTHTKGELAGKSLSLEPWQKAFIGCMFGWKRPDGTRRYREVFIFIPRKNGKTTIVAGIAMYLLIADHEKGAEIYSAAANAEQANLCFNIAKGMIDQNETLSDRLRPYYNSIVFASEGSSYKAISADSRTKHGFNTHGALIDELHAQPDRELYDVLKTSTGARKQPLVITFTTAGYDKDTICGEVYDRACDVRDGVRSVESFLPVIYEAAADSDWKDEKTWEAANPNLGVSISRTYFQEECEHAVQEASYLNTFLRLHLNRWTQSDEAWIATDDWQRSERTIDWEALRKVPCYGGLDLSTVKDTTALALVWPNYPDEGTYTVKSDIFIPGDSAVKREHDDSIEYLTWERRGWVTTTPGGVVDYAHVRKRLVAYSQEFLLQEVGYDPWNAEETRQILADQHGINMIDVRQGFRTMSEPSRLFERLVVSGKLIHDRNECLNWMVNNCAVRRDTNDNIMPTKPKNQKKRIDGVVAIIIALSRAMMGADLRSPYEDRGFVFV